MNILPYNCSRQVKLMNVSSVSLQPYNFGRPPCCYTSLQGIKKYSRWVSFKIVTFTPSFAEIGSTFQNRSLVTCSHIHYDYVINYSTFRNYCRLYKCKAWGKKTNKMQQYRWFIGNSGCWLLTLSQHVSGIFMPIFRRKTLVTACGVYFL